MYNGFWESVQKETKLSIQEIMDELGRVDFIEKFDKVLVNLNELANYLSPEISNNRELYERTKNLIDSSKPVQVLTSKEFIGMYNTNIINGVKISVPKEELLRYTGQAREWAYEYEKLKVTLNERLKHDVNMLKLETLGKAILGRAIDLCPVDTGYLRASGYMMAYEDVVVIAFTAPYATYVHENLNSRHRIGQAKFLEQSLKEFLPKSTVWTETVGMNTVMCSLTYDKKGNIEVNYKHWG